ncbi:hypothetical protein SAMN05444008_10311 [Cnuella takakiae]|uniref:TIGR01777 family protein n=1 Tax=Cnuella takakiae TaxID=1302690 RepID=A0A1M4WFB3_9BACT|nr:TIGR01777 family oxidoreductase [Cnuella takakiae]OLY91733.1 TIGR01777 family protein [Cnuella takakiae]SHE79916.1 hypothetical protein SAMN05444008_10311 [Cnuella takakiae]
MATVIITGGTGLIGRALCTALAGKGHEVIILTRKVPNKTKPRAGISYALWNVEAQTIDEKAIGRADFIVHLAGANVADGRWTEARKQEIVDSRVHSGRLLVKALKETPNKVQAVISSSAIGWYGPDPQIPNPRPFVETDPVDRSFLGTTCKAWEDAIAPVAAMGKRLVYLRTGIVLSQEGGAYKEFRKPLGFGVASILGNGRQVVSWIHIDDIVGLYIKAMEDGSWSGPYNGVAPQPVSSKTLIQTMAKVKGGLAIPAPVPAFVLKTMLGEMSIEVLKSATVSSRKAEAGGYHFQYPDVLSAVKALEGKQQ